MVRLCTALFCVFGFTLGSWQASLPDLVRALQIDPLRLGVCLAIGFAGALPAMFMGGRLIASFGAKTLLMAGGLGMATALACIGFAGSYTMLVPMVVVLLGSSGSFDVAINAVAVAIEQATRRSFLAFMHGAFSLSAAAGALSFGAYRPLGFRAAYVVTPFVLIALILWMSRWRSLPQTKSPETPSGAIQVLLSTNVVIVAGIVAISFLGSGILENWSALYVRNLVSDLPIVSSVGLASFHAAMGIGRLLTHLVLRHVDRLSAIVGCGLMMAVAMVWSLWAPTPTQAVCALFTVGILLSGIAPIGFSLAGELRPDRIGEVTSTVAIAGYASFLVGPVLIGILAEAFGLRAALASVAVVGVTDSLLASLLILAGRPAAAAKHNGDVATSPAEGIER